MKEEKIKSKNSYSFIALLLTFLSFLSWALVPGNLITRLSWAVFSAFALLFSYKSIKKEKKSDKIVGFFCFFVNLILIILFISFPPYIPSSQAKDARITSNMSQLIIIAEIHYDDNDSYIGFEKDSMVIKMRETIIEMGGVDLATNISPDGKQYCIEVFTNAKGWYCVDSNKAEERYTDNPKCSNYYYACE